MDRFIEFYLDDGIKWSAILFGDRDFDRLAILFDARLSPGQHLVRKHLAFYIWKHDRI